MEKQLGSELITLDDDDQDDDDIAIVDEVVTKTATTPAASSKTTPTASAKKPGPAAAAAASKTSPAAGKKPGPASKTSPAAQNKAGPASKTSQAAASAKKPAAAAAVQPDAKKSKTAVERLQKAVFAQLRKPTSGSKVTSAVIKILNGDFAGKFCNVSGFNIYVFGHNLQVKSNSIFSIFEWDFSSVIKMDRSVFETIFEWLMSRRFNNFVLESPCF